MKKVAMGIALALAASAAFAAHPQTINKTGFVGVNRTQSAQSLGHSKLAFYALMDATNDISHINGNGHDGLRELYFGKDENEGYEKMSIMRGGPIKDDYIALSTQLGIGIGLWHYFDLGIGLPVYYDKFHVTNEWYSQYSDDYKGEDGYAGGQPGDVPSTDVGYIGNLHGDLKARFPLPDDQPFDIAVFGEVEVATVNTDKDGIWIRDASYINTKTGQAQAYGARNTYLQGGMAITADFGKLDEGDGVPLVFHVNGGYRYSTDDEYLSYPFMSAAAEFYFMDFLSIFAEYHWDIQLDDFTYADRNGNKMKNSFDMKELTGAFVFHLPVGLDIHLGGTYFLGDKDKMTKVYAMENNKHILEYTARVNPEYKVYGGLTWSGFLLAQDRDGDGVLDKDDKCPDDFGHRLNQGCPLGNPDADEDGVCDAWVAERGLLADFADVCEGVDQCPNEAGEGDDGCPLDDPDPDKDGVCDAWVTQKKLLKKFKGICKGIDQCPNEAGPEGNNGCPEDNADPDKDGLCSPWVTDKNKLDQYADVCKGYDMCPAEAGPSGNKGCPWDDPDSDGDGLCDEWVTQKRMGYYFENAATLNDPYITKTCKGLDKCPLEFGPATNDGCPLGNPDTDKDSLCDPWVKEKGMLDQYEGICKDVDKCPNEPGPAWAQGCPMDNPDPDADSLCSPWVIEKNMTDQFKDVCHGSDRCPSEAGPEWNKGCPFDDDPDPDKDGVCSEWVSTKKLQKQFADVCTGIDRCPDEPGDDGHGCPKKAAEKLDGVTFKSGKATLESNAKNILKGVAKKLVEDESYKELEIVIQGHTDNVGREASNQKLSENRAKEVMKTLTKFGVDKKRIKAIGLGSTCPVDDNNTSDGREQNRRIEMHFVTPDNDGMKCESNFTP